MNDKPFIPHTLPLKDLDFAALADLHNKGLVEIARYDGELKSLNNPNILLSTLARQEAIASSKIENIFTNITQLLEDEAGISPEDEEKKKDLAEIKNYRNVLLFITDYITNGADKISLSLIEEMHRILMSGVRGEKHKGQFRKIQNYIVNKVGGKTEIIFTPPEPLIMKDALDNLEKYIALDDSYPLIQTAVFHGQFEIIHPFGDGNGRLGRLLIPLYLYHKGIMSYPSFYISEYFDNNEDEYKEKLNLISKNNDWHGWIEFFLKALLEQTKINTDKISKIRDLHKDLAIKFVDATRSQWAGLALDAFFESPIISTPIFQEKCKIDVFVTANEILKKLQTSGLVALHQKGAGKRASIYALNSLLDIIG